MAEFTAKGEITLRKEAKRFLKRGGTKVAIQVGYDGKYVFAEKTDFITEVLDDPTKPEHFCNYDGNIEQAWYDIDVLYIPAGTS